MTTTATTLFDLFCSFDHCLRYAKYKVGLDGPLVCSKHAKVIRRRVAAEYASTLAGQAGAR